MAGNDGSIYFSVEIDNKDAYKKLDTLQKRIVALKKQLTEDKSSRGYWLEQADALAKPLDDAKQKLTQMKAAGRGVFSTAEIEAQKNNVKSLEAAWENAVKKSEHYIKAVNDGEEALKKASSEAANLQKKIADSERPSERLKDALYSAEKKVKTLQKRFVMLAASALVFSVVTKAFTALRDQIGRMIKTSDEANASIAKLKGALLTVAQPIVDLLMPAFVTLVNLLTAMAGKLAELTAMIGGTTVADATAAAEALNKEAEAIEGTGDAAKKASKTLASFDQINQLSTASADSGSKAQTTAPDFSWSTGITEQLSRIATDVLAIGAGFALWKISDAIPGKLGDIGTKVAGLAIATGGLKLLWDGLTDAWNNGVDWGNLATMIAGVTAAAIGLYIAFGKLGDKGAGIGLVVGGIAMLVTGFKDIIENGFTLENTLLTIAGIFATGLGIALITGSFIPALIAGVAGILLAITVLTGNGGQLIENLKQIFEGLTKFVTSIMVGDIEGALSGLVTAGKGILNTLLTLFGSMVNLLIRGVNWLISKINTISFEVPDWVPLVGGKAVGFNLPRVNEWKIPQLAQGAVIPPNREFLAVLGDQKSGTNIETPLATMVQAFKQAMAESGGSGETTIILELDGQQFGKATYRAYNRESRRVGVNLAGVNR